MLSPEEIEQTRALADELLAPESALREELPRVYDELRNVAANFLRNERPNHTLQPTALVHEAYMRLVDQKKVDWRNKPQFMAIAARMMRRILVNHAVARNTTKRGSGVPLVSLDAALGVLDEQALSALDLHRALQGLEKLDPRQAQIVEMRFFGGLSVAETAEVLAISAATVKREWSLAKRWLEQEMSTAQ